MALYIPHNIFHLARLLYVRPETFGPYYVYSKKRRVNIGGFPVSEWGIYENGQTCQ